MHGQLATRHAYSLSSLLARTTTRTNHHDKNHRMLAIHDWLQTALDVQFGALLKK
jgi:hypothetical protein